MMSRRAAQKGLTMIELVVAVVAAFLVFSGIASVFLSSTRGFARTENFMQLRTRRNTVLDKLSEEFMQAGADLPTEWNCILPAAGVDNNVKVIANQTGGIHTFGTAASATISPYIISIGAAKGFLGAAKVVKRTGTTYSNLDIQTGQNVAPFIAGVDTVNNRLCFSGSVSFLIGDEIFVHDTLRYYHDATSKELRIANLSKGTSSVYAGNVVTFHVSFYNANGTRVTNWATMKVCSLFVEVRASRREKNVPGDGFRRVSGSKRFFFRNKAF